MNKFEKIFAYSFPLPVVGFAGSWLFIAQYDGWSAFGAVQAIIPSVILCFIYGVIAAVEVVRYLVARKQIPAMLKISILVSLVIPLCILGRVAYLDIKTWG